MRLNELIMVHVERLQSRVELVVPGFKEDTL